VGLDREPYLTLCNDSGLTSKGCPKKYAQNLNSQLIKAKGSEYYPLIL
jgi:hypothetical protein